MAIFKSFDNIFMRRKVSHKQNRGIDIELVDKAHAGKLMVIMRTAKNSIFVLFDFRRELIFCSDG